MRVLIADDNRSLAESLAALLRTRGAAPTVVVDGDDAAGRVRSGGFDALLVDLRLPGTSGPDLLAMPEASGLLRLAMTGYDTNENIDRALAAGASAVLRKPFALPELYEALGLGERTAPTGFDFSRVAAYGVPPSRRGSLDAVCTITSFGDPERFRSAVAETRWDAAIVSPGPEEDELVEDLHGLDPDLAVVRSPDAARLVDAIQRTGDARDRSDRLVELEDAFAGGTTARLLVDDTPPTLRRWNGRAQGLLGFHPEQLRAAALSELDADPARETLDDLVGRARASGETEVAEVRVRSLASGDLTVLARAHVVGARDATVLELSDPPTADRHHEALQLLGLTAAGVAHEIRNMLGGVSGSLKLLADRLEPESEPSELLGRVRDRVAQASAVVNDLLDFARPVTLRMRAVPVTMLLEAAAADARDAAGPNMTVTVDVHDPSMRILTDPARLRMALTDLAHNAIRATGGEGALRFGCRRRGAWVDVEVADDGPGVPLEARDRIFEPFFTTHSTGSGLGLANVRKVAEAHGGSIALAPGDAGARFVITLPTRPRGAES